MDAYSTKVYPELMNGKKILYVHGFASSGASGTARSLQTLFPSSQVISPDLPIHPHEAIGMLRELCEKEHPDLIVGTSMGGMYAEMLYGTDRILVNPSFDLADTILKNNGLGRQEFHNPRKDGQKEFMITKALLEEYREVSSHCFEGVTDEERQRVYALYGLHDTLVDTYSQFVAHYPQAIHFDGEHRLNDSALIHSVLPVVRWIDDKQEQRERPIIYIAFEDTLMDASQTPKPSMGKALRLLAEHYQLYFVGQTDTQTGANMQKLFDWAAAHVGVMAYNHLIFSNHPDMLYGDYLIEAQSDESTEKFMGTHIHLGSDTFKTWEDVITFFERLGGQ